MQTFNWNSSRILLVLMAVGGMAYGNLSAQTVYGMRQGMLPWQEGLFLGGYDALTQTWVFSDTLEYAEGFGLGTSTYDQWEDAYVFLGVPSGGGSLQWMSQSVEPDVEEVTAELNSNLHSIHHDMQNGQFYGLQGYPVDSVWMDWGDGFGYWDYLEWGTRVVELEVVDGAVEVTGLLELEWLQGVVAGASCYDSDLHRFYIWGMDNSGTGRLISIDCVTAEVVTDVTPLPGDNANLSEFEFNINDGTLIGLRAILDGNGGAEMDLVVVDPTDGSWTSQLNLPQVGSYTPDGTVFDQLNGLYILHYYEGMGLNSRIMAVDASDWSVVADEPLAANFIELEMSNADFADLRYATAGVARPQVDGLNLANGCWINQSSDAYVASRFDALGRLAAPSTALAPGGTLDIPSGHWIWQFTTAQGARLAKHTVRP